MQTLDTKAAKATYQKAWYAQNKEKMQKYFAARPKEYRAKNNAARTPEYNAYYAAKYRCTNPRAEMWADYGGRGITFEFESFKQFLEELGPRPAGCSLDRTDNNQGYKLGNVRWATPVEQANNRRF